MDFLKPKLKPIEINIVSVDKISYLKFRTLFEARFRMGSYLAKGLYFNTKGTVETDREIDKHVLMAILETTDLDTFIELNMKKRDRGDFDYQYQNSDNWLTINFKTF